jgi:uncharacterized protein
MAAYFLDSSALVKRYVAESGSVWINGLMRPRSRDLICIAWLTGVEVVSAVARRGRGGSLTPQQIVKALFQFRRDFPKRFRRLPISARLIDLRFRRCQIQRGRRYGRVGRGRPPTRTHDGSPVTKEAGCHAQRAGVGSFPVVT